MEASCFPGSSAGKESTCNAGDLCSIPGLGRSPGEEHGNPLQYACLENPQGQRNLAGYRPWGSKESDTTEQLSIAQNVKIPNTVLRRDGGKECWPHLRNSQSSQGLRLSG